MIAEPCVDNQGIDRQHIKMCKYVESQRHTLWIGQVGCHTEDEMLNCTQRASNKSITGLQGSDAWDLGALGPWGLDTLGPSDVALWPGMPLTQHDTTHSGAQA